MTEEGVGKDTAIGGIEDPNADAVKKAVSALDEPLHFFTRQDFDRVVADHTVRKIQPSTLDWTLLRTAFMRR
jgi:hypothetical protein